jgi:hypothetical protein
MGVGAFVTGNLTARGVETSFIVGVIGAAVAGGLVALAAWLIARGLGWSTPWVALGTTVLGAVVGFAEYFAVAAALRMRELDDLWSLFAPRVRRVRRPAPVAAADVTSLRGPADREGRTV